MIYTTPKEVHNRLEVILESFEMIWIKNLSHRPIRYRGICPRFIVPMHNVPTLRFIQQVVFAIKVVKEYMLVGFLQIMTI